MPGDNLPLQFSHLDRQLRVIQGAVSAPAPYKGLLVVVRPPLHRPRNTFLHLDFHPSRRIASGSLRLVACQPVVPGLLGPHQGHACHPFQQLALPANLFQQGPKIVWQFEWMRKEHHDTLDFQHLLPRVLTESMSPRHQFLPVGSKIGPGIK